MPGSLLNVSIPWKTFVTAMPLITEVGYYSFVFLPDPGSAILRWHEAGDRSGQQNAALPAAAHRAADELNEVDGSCDVRVDDMVCS
jgi:hypothetical protein